MKSYQISLFCLFIVYFGLISSAHAKFFSRLEGLAYYDDQLGITWAKDANTYPLNLWQSHVNLVSTLRLGGVIGWRLPSVDVNRDGIIVNCSLGSTTQSLCKDNEFGHFQLYGAGNERFGGVTPGFQGPFTNLQGLAAPQTPLFWTSTELNSDAVYAFSLGAGSVIRKFKAFLPLAGWYVHDGDVGGNTNDDLPNPVENPIPTIRANGLKDTVMLQEGESLSVSISIEAVIDSGQERDWWVAARSPFGFFWLNSQLQWVTSETPVRAYKGALIKLSDFIILDSIILPPGAYTLYFGVDNNADKILDADNFDFVDVNIQ